MENVQSLSFFFFFQTLGLVILEVTLLQGSKTVCVQPWCKLTIAMKNSESSIIKKTSDRKDSAAPSFLLLLPAFLVSLFSRCVM